MKDTMTVKKIPAELGAALSRSAGANFRSINQEILHRLQVSFDLELTCVTRAHQRLLDEGLASGSARPFDRKKFRAAVKRGLERAAA